MNAIAPEAQTRPIAIAVMALGGQGGGVLVDWIVALAEREGWTAQSTSVPGVAQRTGATVYYIELIQAPPGRLPVLSLFAAPGEVDIVLAAELMEAGRAIQRGLVTPDRTTLITSTHRAYAVVEKEVPGDGAGDPGVVLDAAAVAARRVIARDMAALAERAGSAVSASLFGALAASGALPFPRAAFEAVIAESGIGVAASLRAFALGHDAPPDAAPVAPPPPDLHEAGLARVIDFQDAAYGEEYRARVAAFTARDSAAQGWRLSAAAAKYIAVAMAYDDVIRVADLKTRGARFDRVRNDAGARPGQPVAITEFFHPRIEEICGVLPARFGAWLEASRTPRRLVERLACHGRRVRTDTLRGFLTLYAVAGLARWRRGTLRHARETAHLQAWLDTALAEPDYDLAVELLANRRLVKGYSDTHARGSAKFDRVMAAAARLRGRPDAATWVRRLREAALRDEAGLALDETLRTIDSFL